jgi:drug/metabolite transporter superfamily protein YnfA
MNTLSIGRLGALAVFVCSAILEVGGDAMIRRGLRAGGAIWVVAGFLALGSYGIVVNLLDLDFSRLLGAYVGLFAVVSVLTGQLVFHEQVPASTWLGLAVVLAGSLIIHFGRT